jgi:acetylornithine/N-succinyldiaminopimelate aminotransferase
MPQTAVSKSQATIDLFDQYVIPNYRRYPIALVRGEGSHVWDADGRQYLDLFPGWGCNILGYSPPAVVKAIQEQAAKLIHVPNTWYIEQQGRFAEFLCSRSFGKAFFCNSGAEANEGAIKFARKLAYDAGQTEKTEIVCFSGAFHGRTIATVSLTPKEKYQKPFAPLLAGVVVAPFNDAEAAAHFISDRTAAVIVEPVQGEGGINAATPAFLTALRALCDQHQAVLIFDEVQCGMGRTGTLWAHEASGVMPDIMTIAKPLAGGLPVGAILVTQAVADHLHPGDHGSTFGGGPLVTSAAKVVLARVSQPEFLARVTEVGSYLMERLQEINSPLIADVRGRGLMVGLELTVDVAPLIAEGYQHGLLLVNAGERVLRFIPPLVIDKQHVDVLIDRLTTMLEGLAHG